MLNDEETLLLNGLISKPDLGDSLDIASRNDPDIAAESNLTPINAQLYKANKPEIDRQKLLSGIDPVEIQKSHPKTANWMADPRNSSVAIDDLDILKGLEDSLKEPERGFWNNAARGGLDRVNSVTGNFIEFLGNVSEDFDDYMVNSLGVPNPGIVIGDDGVSFEWNMPVDTPSLITHVGKAVSEGEAYDYQPRFTWEGLKGDVTPTNAAGYIVEQGIQSVPDMLAAMFTLPAYVASRTEEIAEARVENDERDEVTGKDLATSFLPAVAVALMERLGAKATFGMGEVTGFKTAAKAIGTAAVTEGGTEFIQEGIEYLGETVGTKKELSAKEMLDRQFAGLVAGGGMGGGIRTVTSTFEAVGNKADSQAVNNIMSENEQQTIDNIITYAQSSNTNKRAKAQVEELINSYGDREVLVPNDVAMEMEDAPGYIIEQVNSVGADISIPMSKFITEVAVNEQWMNLFRPHIKLSQGTLSQTELSEGDKTELQSLLEKAQNEQQVLTESDKIFNEVKEQIVSTGMQSEQTARHSAAIYPAAVATYVEKAKAMGHEVSPQEIYEMMGFSVEKAKPSDPVTFEQPAIPDDVEIQMDLETIETGEIVQESFNAKELHSEINDRIDNYKRLLDCLG